MKRLTNHQWSLLGKYLKDEATPADLVQIETLFEQFPGLKEEVLHLNVKPNNQSTSDFDAERALKKMHERFKRENLI
ncbi:hypothetical protein [Chryseosolibacter indicus]|uniref:Uncharacterized protein n=1 Tax=Chryseosolibacter indicus TaxID=2782351 RepID=A0ABS5VLM8_9BACT|nr:hypothetical protein [Chryseosolibacter indicus]MBT1701759.1 hypothetical protein [Chryseosolibacter indicus]